MKQVLRSIHVLFEFETSWWLWNEFGVPPSSSIKSQRNDTFILNCWGYLDIVLQSYEYKLVNWFCWDWLTLISYLHLHVYSIIVGLLCDSCNSCIVCRYNKPTKNSLRAQYVCQLAESEVFMHGYVALSHSILPKLILSDLRKFQSHSGMLLYVILTRVDCRCVSGTRQSGIVRVNTKLAVACNNRKSNDIWECVAYMNMWQNQAARGVELQDVIGARL